MAFPTTEEIIEYIARKGQVTITDVSKQFKIRTQTVSDIFRALEEEDRIVIKKIGTAKVAQIKKKK